MVTKFITHKFSLILFFLYPSFIYSANNECSYKDCFNCTYCGNISNKKCFCSWDNDLGQCKKGNENTLDEWYYELTSCTTNTDQFKYCAKTDGKFSIDGYVTYSLSDFSNNKLSIELPEINGKYGIYNYICSYRYNDNTNSEVNYNIEVNFLLDNTSTTLEAPSIIYSTSNENENIKEINETTILTCESCLNFYFIVFLKGSYPTSPFEIVVSIDRSDSMKYLSLCTILICILIVIGIVICCISKYSNKKAREQLRMLMIERARENMLIIQRENNELNCQEYNEDYQEKNRQKLDKLFETTMKEHLYKSEYNQYGGGCSICLENFKKKSKVSMTPCKHVFHFKCIKDWLYKNIKKPKCPNCNNDVLEYKPELEENKKKENDINNNKKDDNKKDENKKDENKDDIRQVATKTVKVKKKKKDKGGIEICRPELNAGDQNSNNHLNIASNRISRRMSGLKDSSQTGRQLNS